MGLTCATVHVFAGAGNPLEVPAALDRLLTEASARLGYERVEDLAHCERHVVVPCGGPWIAALDQLGAGIVTAELAELAAQLSAVSECAALVAPVYDSDEFAFVLYEKGKQVDGFTFNERPVPFKLKK